MFQQKDFNDTKAANELCTDSSKWQEKINEYPVSFYGNYWTVMREEAYKVAPIVLDYLKETKGSDLDSLIQLRHKSGRDGVQTVMEETVYELCEERYATIYPGIIEAGILQAIIRHTDVLCLAEIDWWLWNEWEKVDAFVKDDEAESFVESIFEKKTSLPWHYTVMQSCGRDAAAGIRPGIIFSCMTKEDTKMLNTLADYVRSVYDDGNS